MQYRSAYKHSLALCMFLMGIIEFLHFLYIKYLFYDIVIIVFLYLDLRFLVRRIMYEENIGV